MLDKKIVEDVAHLARIELQPDELDRFAGQLEHILNFIDKLKKANIENVAPANYAVTVSNVLREDALKGPAPTGDLLANAPSKKGKFFVVHKVIE